MRRETPSPEGLGIRISRTPSRYVAETTSGDVPAESRTCRTKLPYRNSLWKPRSPIFSRLLSRRSAEIVRTSFSTETSMSRSGSTPGTSARTTSWSPSTNSSTLMSRNGQFIPPKGPAVHRSDRSLGQDQRVLRLDDDLPSFDSPYEDCVIPDSACPDCGCAIPDSGCDVCGSGCGVPESGCVVMESPLVCGCVFWLSLHSVPRSRIPRDDRLDTFGCCLPDDHPSKWAQFPYAAGLSALRPGSIRAGS